MINSMELESKLVVLRQASATLKTKHEELVELSVTTKIDYSVEGVRVLVDALCRARANSERASQLQSETIRLVASSKAKYTDIVNWRQDVMDEVIIQNIKRFSDRSWAERESIYRTQCIEAESYYRIATQLMDAVLAWSQAIGEIARQVYRTRGDYEAIVQVLRIGEALNELRSVNKY